MHCMKIYFCDCFNKQLQYRNRRDEWDFQGERGKEEESRHENYTSDTQRHRTSQMYRNGEEVKKKPHGRT